VGFFKKGKEQKEELQSFLGSVNRDIGLAQQVAEKEMAKTGVDMATVMAASQQAMQPGAAQAMMAQRDRIMRLAQHGIETPATLRAVQVGAPSALAYNVEATLDWTVEPPGGAPYEARSVDAVHSSVAPALVAGAHCTVRVDPDDPQTVMFWGTTEPVAAPAAPAAAAAGDDTLDRLKKLGELHAQALITDEEFATRKAEILGSE
jgi:hypothetical protein